MCYLTKKNLVMDMVKLAVSYIFGDSLRDQHFVNVRKLFAMGEFHSITSCRDWFCLQKE